MNILNKKYNRLLVIEQLPNKIVSGKPRCYWKCLCDCGTIKNFTTTDLTKNRSKSCGCLRKEVSAFKAKKEKGESGFNTLYLWYKKSAAKRKYVFSLTKTQFKELVTRNCYYCNSEPAKISSNNNKKHSEFKYNGLDRYDNTKGYILENVVPCCYKCNYAKQQMDIEDFRDWIIKLYTNFVDVD